MTSLQIWEIWAKFTGWPYLGEQRTMMEKELTDLLAREARRYGLFAWFPGYGGLFKSDKYDGKALYEAYKAGDAEAFAKVLGVELPAHAWTETVTRLATEIKALPEDGVQELMRVLAA